ncbi:hypothetical protein PENTCL1PPCAC_2166, partial [Pristionchus entomophagus]
LTVQLFSDSELDDFTATFQVLCAIFAISTASYDNLSDPSPDAVQAFNPSNAPDPTCRTNEEYIQCATHCEPTCTNPNPVCIRSCAPAQCQCVYGYVRNEYGECVAANSCVTTTTQAIEEDTTPTYVYITDSPVEMTTTLSPVTEESDHPTYNDPSPTSSTQYEEPTTITTQAYQQSESIPTEAPANQPYSPTETSTAQTDSDSTPEETVTPSSDYTQTAQKTAVNNDVTPIEEDEDVVVVGGSCGENTCRVGFKCDDSSSVGAKCIPYDTRARSSCSSIRCRPGWSCVIAMDGPRCYRNSVLGITDAPPSFTGPEFTGAPVPDYAADATAAANGKSCVDVICPFGLSCFEGDSYSPDPFCRSNTEGRDSSAQLCSDVQCGSDESCTDNHNGPVCTKNDPSTCAATSCLTGSSCVEHPEGARCEAPQGPMVFAGKTCIDFACPDMHQCFDTLDGASCYPIPTDPVEPVSSPLKCAHMTCNEGEECTDDEHGGVCTPQAYASPTTPAYSKDTDARVSDESLQRAGSSDVDCEHTTCSGGEHCAIDFEGRAYCRANEGETNVPSSSSSDPSIYIPLCSEISCPSDHECFDDSVKGAACWPIRRDADPVTSPTVTISTPSSPSCRSLSCSEDELCVEESSGPRCVPSQRRGITAPGYRRRL